MLTIAWYVPFLSSPETNDQFAFALIEVPPWEVICGLLKNCETSTPDASVAEMLKVIDCAPEVISIVEGVAVKLLKTGGSPSWDELIVTPPFAAP